MAKDVIELLKLETENNIHYYRYMRYRCNDINIAIEIHVNIKPFEAYSIEIYKLDEIDNASTLNEGVEVRDADIFIKMIEILENKYKIKIINKKLNYDNSWLSRNR